MEVHVLFKLIILAAAYLMGSLPFGLAVAQAFARVDVRSVGSGNIGATNVARAAGPVAAVLTLTLDALKGAIPIWAMSALVARDSSLHGPAWTAAAGVAAFLGHLFPIWLGFKGGKGVATALGVFAVLAPQAALVGLVTYGAVLALTRISALGSLAATAAVVVGVGVLRGPAHPSFLAAVAIGLLISLRHRENVAGLIRKARGEG